MDDSFDQVTAPRPCWVRRLVSLLLIVIFGAGGAYGAFWLMTNRPQAQRRRPPPAATLVEVMTPEAADQQAVVTAMGTVGPAKAITLAPRVSGEIVRLHPAFIPGGRIAAGETVIEVDRKDYELRIRQREAALNQRLADQQQAAGAVKMREAEIARARAQVEQAETEVQNAAAGVENAQALIEQRAGEIVRARTALRLEEGQQAIAREEYQLLGQELTEAERELVLRQPQMARAEAELLVAEAQKRAAEAQKRAAEANLRAAEARREAAEKSFEVAVVARESALAAQAAVAAAVEAARSELAAATLDLERTVLTAPFDAVVRERHVNIGSLVNAGNPVATLVNTDEFWVEVKVPVDRLRWLNIPGYSEGEPSLAVIEEVTAWGVGAQRPGQVLRLQTDLEPLGRLARLLVSIPEPMNATAEGASPLILGSYVEVRLQGRMLPGVIRVPRDAVHDGQNIWVMTADRTLDIRPVEIAWSDQQAVYLRGGFAADEHIVTSDIGAPVPGRLLRLRGDAPPEAPPGGPEVSRTGGRGRERE